MVGQVGHLVGHQVGHIEAVCIVCIVYCIRVLHTCIAYVYRMHTCIVCIRVYGEVMCINNWC